jgi:catechol 2,3-dioxygenase-like lactoylglutathione lyase family enzyme
LTAYMMDGTITGMEEVIISGIQQIGIGVPDVKSAFRWYRKHFNIDIPAFDDSGEAGYMIRYTGGKPQSRRAVLAINLQGGSGLEIWQFTERDSKPPSFQPSVGDLGIFLARIKSRNVERTYERLLSNGVETIGTISESPAEERHFFVRDLFGNIIQVVESDDWFARKGNDTGGACGCMIGVTDIDSSRLLYSDILGYDRVLYDEKGIFEDITALPGGNDEIRRVLLSHSMQRKGCFSRLMGPSRIELVQCIGRKPAKIFGDRYWGDQGFIHLCFDIHGMEAFREICNEAGFPFTVDSSKSFDMGDAAGHFSYIEDADGTLVEFVETHRLPVMKKLGLYLNLQKRDPSKPLPDWMSRMLSFNRVKD